MPGTTVKARKHEPSLITKSWKHILGEVWLLVTLLIPAAGLALWMLQKIWSIISEDREMKLSSAFFYSISILLGDQSPSSPTHVTARVSLHLRRFPSWKRDPRHSKSRLPEIRGISISFVSYSCRSEFIHPFTGRQNIFFIHLDI